MMGKAKLTQLERPARRLHRGCDEPVHLLHPPLMEFAIAALLIAGAFNPLLSALGSFMGVITFAITWSFFFTIPGVVTRIFSRQISSMEAVARSSRVYPALQRT